MVEEIFGIIFFEYWEKNDQSKELDLICMSVFHDGDEHTKAEFKELFLRTGLKINQVISTNSHISIIETVPA